MRKLINIQDVRDNAKQISKQINSDSFAAYVERIQRAQLTDLLSDAFMYDFINFLDNGFTNYAGTWTRDSESQITISGFDASAWTGYSLKVNDSVFVIVDSAVFGGTDTVLTVSGYDLPATITTLGYSQENKYIKLLNGTTYTNSENKTVNFFGIRAFLAYHFIASYLIDGSLKQGDTGNFKINGDLFQGPSSAQINLARGEYLENSIRESNRIKEYLNQNSNYFELWETKEEKNITSFTWNVV